MAARTPYVEAVAPAARTARGWRARYDGLELRCET